MVVQYFWPEFGQGNIIRMEPTGLSVSYNIGDSPSFHSNGSNNFFFLTREGISYRAANMGISWSETHSLNSPVKVARGNFVAIGEALGGRRVYVYDSYGYYFSVTMDETIQTFTVNESGVLAVIVQTAYGGHGVHIFTSQNTRLSIYHMRIVGHMLQPTSVDVSGCGRYVAVAVLDMGLRYSSTLKVAYLNEASATQWGVQFGIFANESFDMQMIKRVRFMEDNRLVVLLDSQIVCLQVISRVYAVSALQYQWSRALDNYLTHFMWYDNRHFAYITGERRIGMQGDNPVGTMYVVSALSGDPVGHYSLGRRVTHLSMGHGAVIIGADRNFHAIAFNGTHLWEHNSLHETRSVIFLNDTDTVLIAGAHRAEVHERRRVRVSDFEDVFD